MLSSVVLQLALLASDRPARTDEPPFLLRFTHVAADTASIGRLSTTALPEHSEEVRIWVGFGTVAPDHLLRLRVDPAGSVTGEIWVHFSNDLSYVEDLHERHSWRRTLIRNCKEVVRGKEEDVCLVHFKAEPNWQEIYRKLLSLGVTTLPDQSTLPTKSGVLDGVAMVVEVRNDEGYRAYHYSNPAFQKEPEAVAASEIMSAAYEVIDSADRRK